MEERDPDQREPPVVACRSEDFRGDSRQLALDDQGAEPRDHASETVLQMSPTGLWVSVQKELQPARPLPQAHGVAALYLPQMQEVLHAEWQPGPSP